jgi:bacterioferritin-associated ferredoxin
MYVCNCAGITEQDIHDAIDQGAGSLKELRQALNVVNDCCQCASEVKRCLRTRQSLAQEVQWVRLSAAA